MTRQPQPGICKETKQERVREPIPSWMTQLSEITAMIFELLQTKGEHFNNNAEDDFFPTVKCAIQYEEGGLNLNSYGWSDDAYQLQVHARTTEEALDSVPLFELRIRPQALWIEMLRKLSKQNGAQPSSATSA